MPNIKVTRAQWIQLGSEKFSQSGLNGLNVEEMARMLKCNKSGFYWYFKNRGNFVQEIVEYWVTKATDELIQMAEKQNSPQAKLVELINELFSSRSYKDFMFHLRALAVKDSTIGKLVASTENKRLKYIQELLTDLNYSRNEAFTKSKLLYQYYLGWYEWNKHIEPKNSMLKQVLEEVGEFIDLQR
jgi:AcrR family transcriptional regulator